ncbi:hypothetical protein SAMN06298211_1086 [Prevotellaceae bacterium MN60]|nr:hypothetical protein SAMN06298211_1086 [Prevotellaceae bacterium MN60]
MFSFIYTIPLSYIAIISRTGGLSPRVSPHVL